jgi:hypothetical protein
VAVCGAFTDIAQNPVKNVNKAALTARVAILLFTASPPFRMAFDSI